MTLRTRLTDLIDIEHPVMLAGDIVRSMVAEAERAVERIAAAR
jgi:hypothetical protein